MDLYGHFLIHLHGEVLNRLSTGKILRYTATSNIISNYKYTLNNRILDGDGVHEIF
jgi:hypothetical protein